MACTAADLQDRDIVGAQAWDVVVDLGSVGLLAETQLSIAVTAP